jgi:hypothetical protein
MTRFSFGLALGGLVGFAAGLFLDALLQLRRRDDAGELARQRIRERKETHS